MAGSDGMPRLEARVRVYEGREEHPELMGFADLTIGGCFVIKGIRIVKSTPKEGGPGVMFLSFPSRKGTGTAQDKYFEVAHPVTAEAREAARDLILKLYQEASVAARA